MNTLCLFYFTIIMLSRKRENDRYKKLGTKIYSVAFEEVSRRPTQLFLWLVSRAFSCNPYSNFTTTASCPSSFLSFSLPGLCFGQHFPLPSTFCKPLGPLKALLLSLISLDYDIHHVCSPSRAALSQAFHKPPNLAQTFRCASLLVWSLQ